MRYKNISSALPRLVIEKSEVSPDKQIGFLQVRHADKKILVGSTESREFKLMQCLFSPKNFLSARYEPVVQTHERVFGAIRISADALNKRLSSRESAESEMSAIVEKSLQNLREGEAGEYFAFISQGGKVSMEAFN